jgi:uncharacterized peroxidase-related enzyme
MSYINTGIVQPGIVELLAYKSTTGMALSNLAESILLGPSPLSSGDRELIASYVSKLNDCEFCCKSHGAAANEHIQDGGKSISCALNDPSHAALSPKMKALLGIAAKIQQSGKLVTQQDIDQAKLEGANDEEIHDSVLIAAAFCMFNRYVDGLGTSLPISDDEYSFMGRRMKNGYL